MGRYMRSRGGSQNQVPLVPKKHILVIKPYSSDFPDSNSKYAYFIQSLVFLFNLTLYGNINFNYSFKYDSIRSSAQGK